MKKILFSIVFGVCLILIALVAPVYGDLTGTEGFGIDLSSAGAGTDFTVTFDPTEITGGTTWDDGGEASVIWTWDLSAGDPSITFGNGVVNVSSGTLQQGGSAVYYSGGTDVVHEDGGLEADVSAYAGLLAISGGSTSQVDEKSEVEAQLTDVSDIAEADGDTWTGTHDLSGATVTMPKRTSNDNRYYRLNLWNPNALYDVDTQVCIEPNLPANITITEVTVTLDADPTTELDWDLKYADAFIGLANATLIVAIDTTNGTTDVDSGWGDNTVAATKALYIEFAADPDSNITQAMVKIRYDYD